MTDRKPPYTVAYNHKGSEYVIFLPWAEDMDDAQARLKSIGFNGRVIGSNAQQIPVAINSFTAAPVWLFMTLLCWWRNLWRRP